MTRRRRNITVLDIKMNENERKQCEKEHKKDEEEIDEKTVVGDSGVNDDCNSNNNDNEVHVQPVQIQVQSLRLNDNENEDNDGGDYNNHDSECGICEKDGDDDNNDDEYNRIQDAEYYDNTGNYL